MNQRSRPRRIVADGVGRLPAFCHAVAAGEALYVSGTIGVRDDELRVVDGGVGPETTQVLRLLIRILAAGGATVEDIVKINVYLTDMADFSAMNEAYLAVLGNDPPARITVGCSGLALGATVEMDCVAYRADGFTVG